VNGSPANNTHEAVRGRFKFWFYFVHLGAVTTLLLTGPQAGSTRAYRLGLVAESGARRSA
jgi:hypothetical protein